MDGENNQDEFGAIDGDCSDSIEAHLAQDFFGGYSVISPGVEIILGGRSVNGRFTD